MAEAYDGMLQRVHTMLTAQAVDAAKEAHAHATAGRRDDAHRLLGKSEGLLTAALALRMAHEQLEGK